MIKMGVPETVYDDLVFQNRVGTLSLSENELCHHTAEKVSVLGWKKVVRRQVTTAASTVSKPMFKLILKSGNEAIFQMEDRVSLEVLRDDLGERLKTYRTMYAEHFDEPEPAAVNKTRASFSGRRSSTPYSMSVSQKEYVNDSSDSSYHHPSLSSERADRRASTGAAPFRSNYSGDPAKYNKNTRNASARRCAQ